jgi:hypothetical protein
MKRLALVAALLAGCGDDGAPGVVIVDADVVDAPSPPDAEPVLTGDILPQGAVSFFRATSCPDGWALFTDAAGRTIVPTITGELGRISGQALANVMLRPHGHLASAKASLDSVSYVGATGGDHGFEPIVQPAIADLPFVQLLVCKKLSAPRPGHAPAPSGMLVFVAAPACPGGWRVSEIESRFLVGLPEGGTPGASFGGAPLADGETRTHTHPIGGTLGTSSHGIALASGCCGGGYGKNGTYELSGSTDAADATPPYLQLMACQKD